MNDVGPLIIQYVCFRRIHFRNSEKRYFGPFQARILATPLKIGKLVIGQRSSSARSQELTASILCLCHGVYTDQSIFRRLLNSTKSNFHEKLCFSPHERLFRVCKGNCIYARITIGLQDSWGVSVGRKIDLKIALSMKTPSHTHRVSFNRVS